ncbi:hypothetical protein BDW62DRAFT_26058 [Aspergillus aurantiobrunneus]
MTQRSLTGLDRGFSIFLYYALDDQSIFLMILTHLVFRRVAVIMLSGWSFALLFLHHFSRVKIPKAIMPVEGFSQQQPFLSATTCDAVNPMIMA